jgi:L-amino acid N-acyltransferase YncA
LVRWSKLISEDLNLLVDFSCKRNSEDYAKEVDDYLHAIFPNLFKKHDQLHAVVGKVEDKIACICVYTIYENKFAEYPYSYKIIAIGVDDNFSGRGFGRDLLFKVLQEIRQDAEKRVIANVVFTLIDSENIPSQKVFSDVGFETAGKVQDYDLWLKR